MPGGPGGDIGGKSGPGVLVCSGTGMGDASGSFGAGWGFLVFSFMRCSIEIYKGTNDSLVHEAQVVAE